jgi:hypothetical protein
MVGLTRDFEKFCGVMHITYKHVTSGQRKPASPGGGRLKRINDVQFMLASDWLDEDLQTHLDP